MFISATDNDDDNSRNEITQTFCHVWWLNDVLISYKSFFITICTGRMLYIHTNGNFNYFNPNTNKSTSPKLNI